MVGDALLQKNQLTIRKLLSAQDYFLTNHYITQHRYEYRDRSDLFHCAWPNILYLLIGDSLRDTTLILEANKLQPSN
jgi:hypothetical protein